jgi:hypothetical protein
LTHTGAGVPAALTSSPEVWKAHGTAGPIIDEDGLEPRLVGLFQISPSSSMMGPKAVLEQPSPRRVEWYVLGRRSIVLLQSSELNASAGTGTG